MTETAVHLGPSGIIALCAAALTLLTTFTLLVRWAVRIEAKVESMASEFERRIDRLEGATFTGPIRNPDIEN